MANAPLSSLSQPRTVRSRLAQPKAVLLLLPLLVATAGGVTGWIGYRNVAASARAMVESRVVEAAQQVRNQCIVLATEATTLSEHLANVVGIMGPRREVEAWGSTLAHCFAARPALTWLSVSYPDGTFIGMTTENGGLQFTIQDQMEQGRRRDWQWQAGVLTPSGSRTHTGYDPRQRPFYRLATERRAAAWTAPYRFFGSGYAGVSLARPLYDASGELTAVVTIDYTTAGISDVMQRLSGSLGDRLLVHDAAGTVVASAGMTEDGSRSTDDLLTLEDLRDPLASAYAREPASTGSRRARDGRQLHVASAAIDVGSLPWQVAVITDLGPRLAIANAYLLRSALLTGLVVLIAGGLAALYASHLVRMRGLVRQARAVAAEAQAEAAEFGSYVLEKKLGAGGMGEVWRARHRLLARPAALKLIKRSADSENDETAIARFEQEARITASLTSQHTVTVFDFGILDDGTCYYVMELLDGDDLDGFLKQNRRLPPEAVVEILLQVCDSLHEAHEAGLVHRDLKPANIFIARMGCDDHVAKVLDFGLVALAGKRRADDERGERLTMAGFVQGTPGFMAPEQLRDEPLDRRSDVYALGCVAFWLLTGRAVFVAPNLMDELRQHLDQDPPAPSTVASQPIPPALDAIIHACLARDPAQRPASAQELADRLRRCGVVPAFPADLWGQRANAASGTATAEAVQLRVKGRRPAH